MYTVTVYYKHMKIPKIYGFSTAALAVKFAEQFQVARIRHTLGFDKYLVIEGEEAQHTNFSF